MEISQTLIGIIEGYTDGTLRTEMARRAKTARTDVEHALSCGRDAHPGALQQASEALAYLDTAYDTIVHFEGREDPHTGMDDPDKCQVCMLREVMGHAHDRAFPPY